ncbi:MAG TPA: hypothetical protein VF182_12590 [Candidatus Binatia bacterium]
MQPAHDDQSYDILFLGGSVLDSDWGQVEQSLREQLAYAGQRNVRIFNLASAAHTSRDSWLKYAALSEARFDLVVFYHGVNDSRANNSPPEEFRENYGHFSWYEAVNTLAQYHGQAMFALPYTLRWLVIRTRQVVMKDRYVPTREPRADWVRYGQESRSAVSFKHNLEAILDLASQRGDQVLLMTFASYVPADYSLERFKEKRLNYGLHLSALEIWGLPQHVLATVAVHNEIVRWLATQHKQILFVDQASLMTGSALYFNDPYHFTVLGSIKFVENIVRALLPRPDSNRTRKEKLSLFAATNQFLGKQRSPRGRGHWMPMPEVTEKSVVRYAGGSDSYRGGIPERLDDGRTGFLVPVGTLEHSLSD